MKDVRHSQPHSICEQPRQPYIPTVRVLDAQYVLAQPKIHSSAASPESFHSHQEAHRLWKHAASTRMQCEHHITGCYSQHLQTVYYYNFSLSLFFFFGSHTLFTAPLPSAGSGPESCPCCAGSPCSITCRGRISKRKSSRHISPSLQILSCWQGCTVEQGDQ